jgi:hypothetical protein
LLDSVDEKDISEQGEYKWKMALRAYQEVDIRIETEQTAKMQKMLDTKNSA